MSRIVFYYRCYDYYYIVIYCSSAVDDHRTLADSDHGRAGGGRLPGHGAV